MSVTGAGVTVVDQARPASTGVHQQPAYKLVVALEGHLSWASVDPRDRPSNRGTENQQLSRGVVVPPGVLHTVAASGAHRCLLVEPWVDGLPELLAPLALTDALSQQLAADLALQFPPTGSDADLAGVGQAAMERLRVDARVPRRRAPRPQVQRAAAAAGSADVLGDLAASVDLSGVRLRQLVRSELGVTLGQLRLWQRLTAMTEFADGGTPLAEGAATVGFSDQAHLTRTSRRLAGRTPSQVIHGQHRPPAPRELPAISARRTREMPRSSRSPDEVSAVLGFTMAGYAIGRARLITALETPAT